MSKLRTFQFRFGISCPVLGHLLVAGLGTRGKTVPIWESHHGIKLTLSQNLHNLPYGQYEHTAGSPLAKNQPCPLMA